MTKKNHCYLEEVDTLDDVDIDDDVDKELEVETIKQEKSITIREQTMTRVFYQLLKRKSIHLNN